MSKDTLNEDWATLEGKIKQAWGRGLTNDDLKEIENDRQSLYRKLEQIYGYSKEVVDDVLGDL